MRLKVGTFQSFVCSSNELVEYMIIALVGFLENNTRFLQEIPFDICTGNVPVVIKLDTDEFSLHINQVNISVYESGRIVISDCLCVSEGLEDWIGLQDLLFQVIHFLWP